MIRVKICGVNSAEAFDAAADAGADWVGFVFFESSPRFVTPAAAASLSARREDGPARVGLFVDPSDDAIAAALAALKLDVLQIYAPVLRVDDVASRFGVPVWRCCAVSVAADLPRDPGAASAVVIEARAPAGAGRPGGNGTALDWAVVRGWKPGFDWILAGGLTVQNVAQAVAVTGATAVDVSSGVEVSAGVKSGALVEAFVEAAKSSLVLTTAPESDSCRQVEALGGPCRPPPNPDAAAGGLEGSALDREILVESADACVAVKSHCAPEGSRPRNDTVP